MPGWVSAEGSDEVSAGGPPTGIIRDMTDSEAPDPQSCPAPQLRPLDEQHLQRRLVEQGPFARLERVDSIASTNARLVQELSGAAGAGWPHLCVLTAEEQTGGSGRLGRSWASPRHSSLSTSVVLRPALPAQGLAWISLLAGTALTEVLREEYGLEAQLKWPNDVHIRGRKISGILAALAGGGPDAGGALILGCGINVLLTEDQLPTPTSTSVLLELQRAQQDGQTQRAQHSDLRTALLAAFLERFAATLTEAESQGSVAPLCPRITAVMDTIGQEVRVELPGGSAERGTAVGLQPDGALLVEVTHRRREADGPWEEQAAEQRSFSAGDVVHLRRR